MENQVKSSDALNEKEYVENEKLKSQSFFSSFCFFFGQSAKDARRHKCQYCLGFCSVFVVVLMTLIINTVIDKGPIIFLRLAEGNVGEVDAFIESSYNTDSGGQAKYVNLTQIDKIYPDEYNLSPRKSREMHYAKTDTLTTISTETGLPIYVYHQVSNLAYENSGNYKLITIDTEREKEINCGKEYKYEKLGLGECLINEDFAVALDLSIGSTFITHFNYKEEMSILWDHYLVRSGDSTTHIPNFREFAIAP